MNDVIGFFHRSRAQPLEWIGSSHKDLMALPLKLRRHFGYATPKVVMDLARARLKVAEARAKELRDENESGRRD